MTMFALDGNVPANAAAGGVILFFVAVAVTCAVLHQAQRATPGVTVGIIAAGLMVLSVGVQDVLELNSTWFQILATASWLFILVVLGAGARVLGIAERRRKEEQIDNS